MWELTNLTLMDQKLKFKIKYSLYNKTEEDNFMGQQLNLE